LGKILVIGEGEITEDLARQLKDAGYKVDVCSAEDAFDRLRSRPSPGAVILDLSTNPGGAQVRELLHQGGAANQMPTLALLPEEQLAAYDAGLGIDDFVLYPLRPGELEARLRHALARRGGAESQDALHRGALVIDPASYKVFLDGSPVELTYKEYELLRFLASQPDRVFTREALLDKVWGYDFYGGARTVDVHIRRLRSKLEHGGHTFIDTVRGVGYRFRAPS